MSIVEIFCEVDDLMNLLDRWFKEHALTPKPSRRGGKASLRVK